MSEEVLRELPPDQRHAGSSPDSKPAFGPLRWAPWVVVGFFGVVAWLTRAPGLLTRQDDARYLLLARSMRAGTYRDLMWPGAPWHHLYPPGYPALLAVWVAIGGERFDWLVTLQIALSMAVLTLAYDAARRVYGRRLSLLALCVVSVSPWFVEWSGQVASEGALAVCLTLALWASVALPRGRRQTALIVACAVAAPLMRTAGMALPVSVGLWWASERRFRDCAWLTVVAAPILGLLVAWTIGDPTPVAGSSYVGDIAMAGRQGPSLVVVLATRIVGNFRYYLTRAFPVLLSAPTVQGTLIDNVLIVAVIGVGMTAGLLRGWVRFRLAALLVLATVALLALWPYQNTRFMIPVLCPLTVILLDGLRGLAPRARSRWPIIVTALVACTLTASGLSQTLGMVARMRGCAHGLDVPPANCVTAGQASFFRAATFIHDSLPSDARILSAKSEPLYIYSHHPTTPLSLWAYRDSSSFWNGMQQSHTDFVLLGELQIAERGVLGPRLAAHCQSLALVATFLPHTYLFRIESTLVPGGIQPVQSGAGRSAACLALDDYLRTAPILT